MLVGRSAAMQALRAQIGRLGATHFTVLITGESGTGKELVARSIHGIGSRSRGPFVAVNCAALVESLLEAELFGIEERTATGVKGRQGKFELAEGGTLFLDEVGDLSGAAQAKLLRVLQDLSVERVGGSRSRLVDTRVIAATNRRLDAYVQRGEFRADLFYRLSGVEVLVPPLRDRRDDIPLLIDHVLGRHHRLRRLGASETAVEAMCSYDWPGNVRQLERVLERAIALAPTLRIELGDLPPEVVAGYQPLSLGRTHDDRSLRAWSSRYVRSVLHRYAGNKRRTCHELDISYHTLRTLLRYDAGAQAGDASALTNAGSPLDGCPRAGQ
jgi:transcriptional regulator with PAS, ATPase and Fis domain